jgi:pyrimidine-nucleoside phosphorylase
MTPYEIIAKKRDGKKLSRVEIKFLIQEFLDGDIKDYQISAFLMAVFFRGMDAEEIFALTEAYLHSGKILDLSHINGAKIDKHSTGGVGDKVSIVLAPLAACLGVVVPMISGRGLGHTGGTLDKLESIPGLKVSGTLEKFKKQLKDVGVAMFGQTADIVPADRLIYSLRDVTATVDSIPLITASIMSKKIASGIDGLVLDVKYGNGAFVPDLNDAKKLAKQLINIGTLFNKSVVAYLTSMAQPLGNHIGNWLEITECIDCMQGQGPADLKEIVITLTTEMLIMAGIEKNREKAQTLCEDALLNGKAFSKFVEMVRYQGGDVEYIYHPENYSQAKFKSEIKAWNEGYISTFNTKEIGLVAVHLGAGRLVAEDSVDPQAGIIFYRKLGDLVKKGEPILVFHTNDKSSIDLAKKKLQQSIKIEEKMPILEKLVRERMTH